MGPYLRWDETVIKWGEVPIPLPAQTIAYLFPPFVITAIHAYRYTTVVMLALSVMVGRMTHHWAWGIAFLLELILLSPIPWPVPVTEVPSGKVIEYLAEADDGAVFTAPIAKENLHDLGRTLLLQTMIHIPCRFHWYYLHHNLHNHLLLTKKNCQHQDQLLQGYLIHLLAKFH